MNFTDKVKYNKITFLQPDYPLPFVDSITKFRSTMYAEDSIIIIPPSLFDEHKPFILIDNLFCGKNKKN